MTEETKVIKTNKRNKKRKGKLGKPVIIIFFIALVILIGAVGITVLGAAKDTDNKEYYNVTIPMGSGSSVIAEQLEDEGIIKSAFSFKVYSRLKGAGDDMKAGSYSLSPSMSVGLIIETLTTGDIKGIPVTIIEGMTVLQIAEEFDAAGITTTEEFLEAEKNGNYDFRFMDQIPEENEYRLEGFLYPNTYNFAKDTDAEVVINAMLKSFDENFTDKDYDQAEQLGYSVLEIITMASIVEKEAALDDERATVASVFYNRLDIGMTLGSDPTVNYITGKIGEEPTASDLEIDSPYNTRLNPGLPPGPICSPGAKSIEAALYPDETEYLYFVVETRDSLNIVFTETYEEHLEAVDVYYNS